MSIPESSRRVDAGLPIPPTSFVGRASEIAAIRARLAEDDVRLLTLTGPGGSGKTRLALHAAEVIADDLGTETVFVDCSPLQSAAQVVPAVAQALCISTGGIDLLQQVAHELQAREPLLVLDNLEQIPDVGESVRLLLTSCPALMILATSRVPIRLTTEFLWPVAPLALPTESDLVQIQRSPAVQLFMQRARQVQPALVLNAGNAAAIAEICARLDGLPLAIELAASRMRALSISTLRALLAERMSFLSSSATDRPDRQRMLGATIAWSYDLLTEEDQAVFRALSVIPGHFSLEMAFAVAGHRCLAEIERLVDHSLLMSVSVRGDETQFRMLETIREYGLLRAEERGDALSAHDRLADWIFESLVLPYRRLESFAFSFYLDNEPAILASLTFLDQEGRYAELIEVVNALFVPWMNLPGRLMVGIDWTERVLARADGVENAERVRTVIRLAPMLEFSGDFERANALLSDYSALISGDHDSIGLAADELHDAGQRLFKGQLSYALECAERGRRLAARHSYPLLSRCVDEHELNLALMTGDWNRVDQLFRKVRETEGEDSDWYRAALTVKGRACAARGEIDEAKLWLERAFDAWSREDYGWGQIIALSILIQIQVEDDVAIAAETLEKARLIAEPWRNFSLDMDVAGAHGIVLLNAGDFVQALDELKRALAGQHRLQLILDEVLLLRWLAVLAAKSGDLEGAARLLGGGDGILQQSGYWVLLNDSRSAKVLRAQIAGRPSLRQIAEAWGRKDRNEVVAHGLAYAPPAQTADTSAPIGPTAAHGLTERECEVLRLVAAGKTNAEIGDELFISPLTAKTHVANLLSKIGVEKRAAAASWAVANGFN